MERLALTPKEAAALLGCSVSTIYRGIKAKEIDAEKVGGVLRVKAASLVAKFGPPTEVAA